MIAILVATALAVALALAMAGGASAAGSQRKTVRFEYAKDIKSWYWERQIDVLVEVPGGPVAQRVRLPNPQNPFSLPVSVMFQCDPDAGGCAPDHERMSALKINLFERGVTEGSDISNLELAIVEGQDNDEQPEYNPEEASIQACRIDDFLVPGENEEWSTRPSYSDTDCVVGKRHAKSTPVVWTFDLTRIAQGWGEDPFSNNGVMFLGKFPEDAGPDETWQVNLKVPARDDPETQPDEYNQTKDRVTVDLAFTPGEEEDTTTPSPSPSPTYSYGSGTTYSPGTGTTYSGGTTTGTTTGLPTPSPSPSVETAASPVAAAPPEPRLPAYVWILLPLGLLALAAVRSVVLEPAGGARSDGAIAAIRRRNAERRGRPLREVRDPLASAWGRARHGVSRAGSWFANAARKVRRR